VNAEIVVYDVRGRRVRTLVNKFVPAGYHEAVWDGRDDFGNRVASGVYLYQLRAGGVAETRKMVLLK
jgi:flagellar hook assembly protein FlgD